MKKILQILLLSIGLIGCSSIKLDSMAASSPSAAQTDKILALGLTFDENIIEARKLTDTILAAQVVNDLLKRKQEAEKAIVDSEDEAKYAEMVKVLDVDDNQIKFIGPVISLSRQRGLVDNYDYQDYFLQGLKNKNNSPIQHHINLSITYTSSDWRNYNSAISCNKWESCKDEDQLDIELISSVAKNCISSSCDYIEVMELNLTDDFLRSKIDSGFSLRFNSKRAKNKITIPSSYIKGYLQVAK